MSVIEVKRIELFLSKGICERYIILVMLLLGCTSPDKQNIKEIKNDLYIIDIESVVYKEHDILLSEIADNIEYIPLETRTDNVIDNIIQLELTESYIFVCDKNRLLQFARDGKFIRQIGNNGHGPGEYSSIIHFSVNETANTIIVQGEFKMNRYDMDGNFIRNESNSGANMFVFYSPTRMAFYRVNDKNNPVNLVIKDQNLMPLYKFQNRNPRRKTSAKFSNAPLYVFENELYFKENYNDTVYLVRDSLLIPHIIYKEGKLLIERDFDLRSTGNVTGLIQQLEKIKDRLINEAIFETKHFVLTSYYRGLDPRETKYTRVLFNKIKNEARTLREKEFLNDLDGGVNFWPEYSFEDSIMISHCEAFEMRNFIATEAFKISNPKYLQKKRDLENIARNLMENDNPVLMLVKLKD